MKLSLVIINFRTARQTVQCIQRILPGLEKDWEIILVDNNSADDSVELFKKVLGQKIKLIESKKNLGFAGGCRLGVESSSGNYLAFINSDCEPSAKELGMLVDYLDLHPDTSVAVPKLLNTDGSIQNNVAKLPRLGSILNEYLLGRVTSWYGGIASWKDPMPVESFSGAAFVIRREDYEAVGGFSDRYFMYVEDTELSLQLQRQNKLIQYLPSVVFPHHSGGSSHKHRVKLNNMLVNNRIDYIKRHFQPVQAVIAIMAIRLGIILMSIKNAIKTI